MTSLHQEIGCSARAVDHCEYSAHKKFCRLQRRIYDRKAYCCCAGKRRRREYRGSQIQILLLGYKKLPWLAASSSSSVRCDLSSCLSRRSSFCSCALLLHDCLL